MSTNGTRPSTPRLSREGYRRLTAQVRSAVQAAVPAGATVAVVSRGDDDMVRHAGRVGWHFPRTDEGKWLGYHPASGPDAVRHLEAACAGGADYLVVPATAFWWLDHYGDFARHLAARHTLVSGQNGSCRIYRLRGSGRAPARAPAPGRRGSGLGDLRARQLRTFLDAVLPASVAVAVAVTPDRPAPNLGPRPVHALPWPPDEPARARGALDHLAGAGCRHLVVPCPDGPAEIRAAGSPGDDALPMRRLAVRPHVCTLFSLDEAAVRSPEARA